MSNKHDITGADLKATERTRPAFEHARLSDPTQPLEPLGAAPQTLDELLERAARWAILQGSAKIRLPHLFAALLGDGTDARWEWLRTQKIDVESLKQRVLLLVPPHQSARRAVDELTLSASVQKVLDGAQRRAAKDKRNVGIDDVYRAFFADAGVVGDQLAKWGVKIPD